MLNYTRFDALNISHAISCSWKRIAICHWFVVVLHMQLLITAYIFLPKHCGHVWISGQ